MRIRRFRHTDAESLLMIEERAARAENRPQPDPSRFLQRLADSRFDAQENIFIITDDDDDLQVWGGQSETLEGIEGEIAGYILVQQQIEPDYYRFLAQGAVDPIYAGRRVEWALLIGALNRARHLASEFEFEAEEAGKPIYFDALLPLDNSSIPTLINKLELSLTQEPAPLGFHLYRLTL